MSFDWLTETKRLLLPFESVKNAFFTSSEGAAKQAFALADLDEANKKQAELYPYAHELSIDKMPNGRRPFGEC